MSGAHIKAEDPISKWLLMRCLRRHLVCPLCKFRFSYRRWGKAAGACPRCKVPIGFSFRYGVIVMIASYSAMGCVMYQGYVSIGTGWLLIGPLFAFIVGMIVQLTIELAFPPKLEPHAQGNIWLNLH